MGAWRSQHGTLILTVLAFVTMPYVVSAHPLEGRQSREQDRSRAEDVKIGRDWKAQGGENDHAGQAAPDQDHQTVGRDWRARPEKSDRQ